MRALRFVLLLAPLLAVAGCATMRQPPLAAPGISREEKVMLGGLEQTIFIRGRNRANPVLLFLHGGPGIPEMPFSHINAELEKDFVVVHWDQRGAGKSYAPGIPPGTMTVREFVRETEELTRDLRARFGQRKIYLAGFSWGSLVGILAASHHPEYYRAYVGISQLVDVEKSEVLLKRGGIAEAEARGFPKIAQELRGIAGPPYKTRHDERLVNKLTKEIQPSSATLTQLDELILFLESPYYSIFDIPRVLSGIRFSGTLLEAAIYRHTLETQLTELNVPVWFFLGRHDTVLSAPLGAAYFRQLTAPRGKHLVWFENSGHAIQLEQPARFREEMRRVLAATRTR